MVRADVFRIYFPENDIPATALSKLLWRSNKAMRDGTQLSEAITGDGATIFRHACWMDLEGIVSKRIGSRYVSGRTWAWLKTNPNFERQRLASAHDPLATRKRPQTALARSIWGPAIESSLSRDAECHG